MNTSKDAQSHQSLEKFKFKPKGDNTTQNQNGLKKMPVQSAGEDVERLKASSVTGENTAQRGHSG